MRMEESGSNNSGGLPKDSPAFKSASPATSLECKKSQEPRRRVMEVTVLAIVRETKATIANVRITTTKGSPLSGRYNDGQADFQTQP